MENFKNHLTIHHDVFVRDQKHEWREHYCKNCKAGLIKERKLNVDRALDYLKTIGKNIAPPCIPVHVYAMQAIIEKEKRGENSNSLFDTQIYPCVHKYCEKLNV